MKIGEKSLKMSDGTIRHFKSKRARDNFEKVARADKHGWRPGKGKAHNSDAENAMMMQRTKQFGRMIIRHG